MESLRSYRILGFAVADFLAVYVAARIFSPDNIWNTFVLLILLGILVHKALGIDTKLNRMIFST